MPEARVRVVHISDIHFSETLFPSPEHLHWPMRFGHHLPALLALDRFLNEQEWDLLLISGDLTRIGSADSYLWVRNWLEGQIRTGATRIGLDLGKRKDRFYALVPGNHDRFNGRAVQTSLDNFHREFAPIRPGEVRHCEINTIPVHVHLFDSTPVDGTFAHGRILPPDMIPRPMDERGLDIAMLHHHLIQPVDQKRIRALELLNHAEATSFLMAQGFTAICFGHTHKSFCGWIPGQALVGKLPDHRWAGRLFRSLLPRQILRALEPTPVVPEPRQTRDGRYPSRSSHWLHLYLSAKLGLDIPPPQACATVAEFYRELKKVGGDRAIGEIVLGMCRQRMLISMAPSACCLEAEPKGLHCLDFSFRDGRMVEIGYEVYLFDGGNFVRHASRSGRHRVDSPI